MAEDTKISWADSTANLWTGCQKVSPGCDHCYAEALMDGRFGKVKWGPHGERQRVAQGWKDLKKWERAAAANGGIDPKLGRRRRVFINSLADFFDSHRTVPWRGEAWALFRECPSLDIMLLTKRPQNIEDNLPSDWGDGWPNIWLGTTAENQPEADRRLPILSMIPAAVRFVSFEPLISHIDVHEMIWSRIHWAIIGGESGDQARPMHPEWARSLIHQARRADVAVLFKQWGEYRPADEDRIPKIIDMSKPTSLVMVHDAPGSRDARKFAKMEKVGKAAAGEEFFGELIQEFPR